MIEWQRGKGEEGNERSKKKKKNKRKKRGIQSFSFFKKPSSHTGISSRYASISEWKKGERGRMKELCVVASCCSLCCCCLLLALLLLLVFSSLLKEKNKNETKKQKKKQWNNKKNSKLSKWLTNNFDQPESTKREISINVFENIDIN